ncbi:MAG: serine hydrolase domain-containing protein, partial [Chloroflexota bacterium]
KILHKHSIPGLQVGIRQGNDVRYTLAHGKANLEHSVPVSDSTTFEIASVTKPMTAMVVLALVDEGRVDLDASIANYLDIPKQWDAVTVRHCLAHQSGIPNYINDAYWSLTRKDKTHTEILDLVRNEALMYPPGARNHYDNTGYYLLGMLVEACTGQSYADAMQQYLCQPLNMTHTRANDYRAILPNRAQGYVLDEDSETLLNKDFYSTSNTFSAGTMVSTAGDLLKWADALTIDSILSDATRPLLWTAHPSEAGNERDNHYSMGLGFFIVDHPRGQFVGHNGMTEGYVSAFVHFRERDTTLALLCNRGGIGDCHEILFTIADEVVPEWGFSANSDTAEK